VLSQPRWADFCVTLDWHIFKNSQNNIQNIKSKPNNFNSKASATTHNLL
jgi:hypothetical protein